MTDNQIQALQAQVDSLQTTVQALLAQPAAKSFDSTALLERIDELETQVSQQTLNKHAGIEAAVSRIQAAVMQKMNSSLHDFAKVSVSESVGAEKRMRDEMSDSKRTLENQITDASSAMLRLASMSEITAKTASDRISAWLAEKV